MKLKALNSPVAEKMHDVGLVITLVEVGLVRPNGGSVQPEIVPASPVANPLPETVTTVPTGPELGLTMIEGEVLVTMNVAWPTSPTGLPSTWITYGPVATLSTVKLKAVNSPLAEKVHEPGLVITLVEVGLEIPYGGALHDEIVPASPMAKPLPDTVTTVPTGPDFGLTAIVGVFWTVNVSE